MTSDSVFERLATLEAEGKAATELLGEHKAKLENIMTAYHEIQGGLRLLKIIAIFLGAGGTALGIKILSALDGIHLPH